MRPTRANAGTKKTLPWLGRVFSDLESIRLTTVLTRFSNHRGLLANQYDGQKLAKYKKYNDGGGEARNIHCSVQFFTDFQFTIPLRTWNGTDLLVTGERFATTRLSHSITAYGALVN